MSQDIGWIENIEKKVRKLLSYTTKVCAAAEGN